MATYTEILASQPEAKLRPFDAHRDLGPVADLVELCFADTLDRDGKDYLNRMRAAAGSSWLSWATRAEWSSPAMGGFVWQEGERLLGNASLIPYFIQGRRFYLIANVAVHPEARRRGIARKLTLEAVNFARTRLSPAVWLHVREDNDAAVNLYLDLGFREQARRTSWSSSALFQNSEPASGEHIAAPHSRNWKRLRSWFERDYPPELSWHMPLDVRALQPGPAGWLYKFWSGASVRQLALLRGEQAVCSAAWQPYSGHHAAIWLAAPDDCPIQPIHALLSALRRSLPHNRPSVLDYPAHRHVDAIRSAGFTPTQTLIWMKLDLKS